MFSQRNATRLRLCIHVTNGLYMYEEGVYSCAYSVVLTFIHDKCVFNHNSIRSRNFKIQPPDTCSGTSQTVTNFESMVPEVFKILMN